MSSCLSRNLIAAWIICWALNFTVAAPPPDLSELVPLTTLGTQKYHGFVGGLYPEGENEPTGQIAAALTRVSREIRPLNSRGEPRSDGKIVVAGIGASVCRQIFAQLETLTPTDNRSPAVVFVNCALGGQDVNKIADPAERYWNQASATLADRGVTAAQVQVVWYQSDDLRDARDDFPGRPQRLKKSLVKQMQLLQQHFPNVRICYHSARHTTAFMPDDEGKAKHAEPRPYHVGWAVKWLMEDQANGRADLAFEGPTAKAPLIAWSTYFWTAGDKPRDDGYRWTRDDVVKDGVHFSPAGQQRVANELVTFFSNDPYAKNWFQTADPKKVAAPGAASPSPAAPTASQKKPSAGETAWIVNGNNKMPKLKRLVGSNDLVRAVVRNLEGQVVADLRDILNSHTDLNKLLGAGDFRLEFLDGEGRRIELTQPVGETVRLK